MSSPSRDRPTALQWEDTPRGRAGADGPRRTGEVTATTTAQQAVTVGRGRPRLLGLDAARGLAIIGMIVVNVGPTNADTVLERLYLLPFGRASVLFVVLAGLGMGLFMQRRSGRVLWRSLVWRVLLLLVLGLVLQTLTQRVSVILSTYALLFLLAPLVRHLGTRALVAVTGVLLVAGPVWIVAHDVVSPGIHAQEGVDLRTPPVDALHSLLVTGPYPLASWTVPFLVGLLLARADLWSTAVLRRLAVWGAVAAVAGFLVADLAYAALGSRADHGWLRLLTGVAHGQMPLWLVSATGGGVFVVAVCLRISRRPGRPLRRLGVLGTYALSIYVAHVLVLAVLPPPEGLLSFPVGAAVSATMVVTFYLLALAWSRTGLPGPLEWVLRHPWLRPAPSGGPGAAPPPDGKDR
ncbi:acyltransferase family protein [Ornithinimicrobium sp. W1679]|uniref:acyltransferase family protein n=1 Tax=unclassified Ornithinimicrobium TaxID=2615080 RepID=UPI003CF6CD9B